MCTLLGNTSAVSLLKNMVWKLNRNSIDLLSMLLSKFIKVRPSSSRLFIQATNRNILIKSLERLNSRSLERCYWLFAQKYSDTEGHEELPRKLTPNINRGQNYGRQSAREFPLSVCIYLRNFTLQLFIQHWVGGDSGVVQPHYGLI